MEGKLSTKLVSVQGAQLELISTPSQTAHPPLLFLHGAGHAAWCWAERFMPWLADQGLECHALSFRGHVRNQHMRSCVNALCQRHHRALTGGSNCDLQ